MAPVDDAHYQEVKLRFWRAVNLVKAGLYLTLGLMVALYFILRRRL